MKPTNHIPTYFIRLFAVCSLTLLLTACGSGDGDDPPPGPGGTDVEVVSFTPDSAFVGDEVEIAGLGFSPDKGENQVWFNDTEATIDRMDMSENNESGRIFTIVPEGATTGPIAVSVNGGERAESGSDFIVRVPEQQEEGEEFARLYWSADKQDGSGNRYSVIGTSYTNEQGRTFSDILYELWDITGSTGSVYALALDLNNNMMYWANFNDGFIARSSLDGNSESVDMLYSQADGDNLARPVNVVLDLEAQEMYWADFSLGIMKGSLDGSAPVETVYDAGEAGISSATGIDMMLDPDSDILYWVERNSNEIVRAPKDGSGSPEILYEASDATPPLTSNYLFDMVIDAEGGSIFIGYGDNPDNSRILKGNLDGTGALETLYSGADDYVLHPSLAYDARRDFLYWSQKLFAAWSGVIVRGRVDGSGDVEVVYDLREIQTEYGISEVKGLAVAPDPGSAKAKRKGYLPPVYLKF